MLLGSYYAQNYAGIHIPSDQHCIPLFSRPRRAQLVALNTSYPISSKSTLVCSVCTIAPSYRIAPSVFWKFLCTYSFQAATVLPPLEGIGSISGYGSFGRMSRSSSRAGCHGWDLLTGATSITDAFSSQTFLRHLQIRQKGKKAYPVPLAH